jgi:hypothetical protein
MTRDERVALTHRISQLWFPEYRTAGSTDCSAEGGRDARLIGGPLTRLIRADRGSDVAGLTAGNVPGG